jgi:hypothetical protein
MPPTRRKSRWPLPSTVRVRYEHAAFAALAAFINPPHLAPPGYNDVCLSIWRSFHAPSWMATSEELTEAIEGLYQLLADAAMLPDGSMDVTGPRAECLLAAKRRVDVLYHEALACGLLVE